MAPTLYTTMHQGPMTAPTAGWAVLPTSTVLAAAAAAPSTAAQISLGGIPALAPYLPEPASPATANVPTQTILSPMTPAHSQGPSPSPPTQYPLSVTMCMEVVWHGEFQRLFSNFQQSWTLSPTASPPPDSDGYKLFQDSAKVRFSCDDCGRGWTSMKGRVAFWFAFNQLTNSGDVLFKLYGQQCQRCQEGGRETFHHAMWYPEEVVKVIQNLYNRVGTVYYGFQLPPIRIDRRNGKPRAQHDTKLCQACKDGLCREGWTLN